MELKTVEPLAVLRDRRRVTLAQVGALAAGIYPELERQAAAGGLRVEGPPVFAAHGLPQDAQTPFELDYCLPVAGAAPHTLPRLRCASLLYQGPLDRLFSQGYQPLLRAIAEAGLTPTAESREVYHAWAGPQSAANRIEIQIGVAEG
ncbi:MULTISPECIES: GyrI-like domain-containing protein [unclassified Achromobacter]|uniref:GyrI-like domain-containing protein n=1 Tax=unclassified Achromobacter TaxID=2626865 RepID=UPI00069D9AAB|nr:MULTISPECIES: GyrI-like domain-containing protein [unclassified Achromobacter]KOF53631.1 transcriptional regulator [Achromobacter sp. DMS1]